MPELPEVETWRQLAEQQAVGKRIQQACARDDRKVFDQNAPASVSRNLKGLTVTGTERCGKHLWLRFDQPGHLYLHFGMTGSLRALQPKEALPSHWKLVLAFEDGTRLLYRNLRRIGKVRWMDDPTAVPPVSNLGPDPLRNPDFTPAWIGERLAHRNRPVKAALLDQSLFAGVGNWIADEVLYQCGLNPSTRCHDLTPAHHRKLHHTLIRILQHAVKVRADASRFPRTWLFHHRWGKKAETDAHGHPIRFDTIGGRTTAWVPALQEEGVTIPRRTPKVPPPRSPPPHL